MLTPIFIDFLLKLLEVIIWEGTTEMDKWDQQNIKYILLDIW